MTSSHRQIILPQFFARFTKLDVKIYINAFNFEGLSNWLSDQFHAYFCLVEHIKNSQFIHVLKIIYLSIMQENFYLYIKFKLSSFNTS